MSVNVFLTDREIDGDFYSEQISARSWDEAQSIASRIGSRVIGELQFVVCVACGSDIISKLDQAEEPTKVM